ncbi:hypothetical protein CHLRE_13g580100v5 [Chlamydomonas reinhardtii]|uniref:Uncharacterized protein n=1 Tax=Chlamydomonas reinhardtii TaxID=3055 RepID=A0A2K3D0B2_CHLRE|nr:uncharacterized protein CHLRE_13g580100v5 [Chlamydomonas reinhardtii]PNW73973.1 hypothetical protein CHLRE_13g580100v5 [Chlamydomonas reinhardtii]
MKSRATLHRRLDLPRSFRRGRSDHEVTVDRAYAINKLAPALRVPALRVDFKETPQSAYGEPTA